MKLKDWCKAVFGRRKKLMDFLGCTPGHIAHITKPWMRNRGEARLIDGFTKGEVTYNEMINQAPALKKMVLSKISRTKISRVSKNKYRYNILKNGSLMCSCLRSGTRDEVTKYADKVVYNFVNDSNNNAIYKKLSQS